MAKWIEFIRVRSTAASLAAAMPTLRREVDAFSDATDGAEAFFLQHALYDGDLALAVVWRNEIEPRKTRDGLLLAGRLRELGPVEHAVWIPPVPLEPPRT